MIDQSPEWQEYKKNGHRKLLTEYSMLRDKIQSFVASYVESLTDDKGNKLSKEVVDLEVKKLLQIQILDPVDPEIRDNFKSGNPLQYCQACGREMGIDVIMKGFYFNKAMMGIPYLEVYMCLHCVKDIDMATAQKPTPQFAGTTPIQHLSFWRKLWNLLTE